VGGNVSKQGLTFLFIQSNKMDMKLKGFLSIFVIIFWVCGMAPSAHPKGDGMLPQVLVYAGKSYKGTEDPEYISYDLALRAYWVKRINERFGVGLDPKAYSGFDLLEMEALFKCKKSGEPFDIFLLKRFPKRP